MSRKWVSLCVLMLSFALFLSACGGGGGSSSGGGGGPQLSALVVADKVSVVSAATTTAGKPSAKGMLIGLFAPAYAPSNVDSAYYTDKTDVWVSERSAESFNTINDILCMIGQTRYDVMLNAGNYIALVDQNQCSSSKSSASSAGQDSQNQSSGADMPNYMSFTVNSSRASETSPEIVKVWIHQPASEHDSEMLIYARLVIEEGKSDTNPYGIFSISFLGYPIVGGVPTGPSNLKGTLQAVRQDPADLSSRVLLKFVGTDGGGTGLTQITLDRQPDGSAGAGVILQTGLYSGGSQTTNFNLAFNSANFYREDLISAGSPTVCLDRSAFSESAWSYALYDANGDRVVRNSGFPITFGTGGRGWIGYWGLWTENNAVLNNGATVNKVDYNNGSATSTPYTVFKSGGKLKKHTKKLLTLNDIKNIPLNYFEQMSSGPTGTNYQVVWDGGNFNKVAAMPQNCSGNCTWADISQPYPTIDVSNLSWGNLNFWSQSLGGQVQVPLSSCTYTYSGTGSGITSCALPTNATQVVFYAEDLVYPGDVNVPASFSCYDQCPKADVNGVNPNDPFAGYVMSGPTATYTYASNTMALQFNGFNVISTATSTANQWGIMSGALFEPTQTNLNLLDCNWDWDGNPATNPQVCGWKAWSVLPVFYTWETGPNTWNQFIGLKDGSNNFVSFEPPLQVKYVHHQANVAEPDFKYDGASFMMEYAGFGQLNGVPGKCVNLDTGADANCADSQNSQSIRWVPVFTIPSVQADSSLTVVTDPADNQLYVKPLHIEQRMKAAADSSACSAIAATDFTAYEPLPDLTIWSNPQTANGAKPTVTAAPAVIGGVLQ